MTIRLFSAGAIILIILPLITLLLDIFYGLLSEGKLPSFVPRLTIASITLAGTVLATILLLGDDNISGTLLAILVGQFAALIINGAMVSRARTLTKQQVRQVIEEKLVPSKQIDAGLLTAVYNLADELIDEDLHPRSPRTRLSGDDNHRRRVLFLRIASLLVDGNKNVNPEDLVLSEEDRSIYGWIYTLTGVVSVGLFLWVLYLSTMRP